MTLRRDQGFRHRRVHSQLLAFEPRRVSGQASWRVGHHRITAGAAWDGNSVTFQQATQFGYLNPDRVTITTIPFYADGSSNSNGVPVDNRVNLHGTVNTPGIFASSKDDECLIWFPWQLIA